MYYIPCILAWISNSEIKLISVEEGCTYTLKDFGLLQVVAVSKGQQLLHSLREEIVAVIASACQVGVSLLCPTVVYN